MRMKRIAVLIVLLLLLCGCTGQEPGLILGADVSSLIAQERSGTVFYSPEGQPQDAMKTLADAGCDSIRVRVWVDPYDPEGNGYGGGNCDLENAIALGKRAAQYGMGLLVDFHYSDFWADPGKQKAPKGWETLTFEEKKNTVFAYTTESLAALRDAGVAVDMVQIGNETNGGFCGESAPERQYPLMAVAARAVRQSDPSIRIAVHYTDPQSGSFPWFAETLESYGVDYDIFAASYYPYWHGTTENLKQQLQYVINHYGKQVMVAETAWPYTAVDADGHPNAVSDAAGQPYPFTPEGQMAAFADLATAMASLGSSAVGIFYWEPAWIPVPGPNRAEKWETYGSGWASSNAADYDPDDAGRWYGGSAWDNQALFDAQGHPLPSIGIFGKE
jgi:arabinogalactan endo-1,4-beta-galactosidase